jgi:hypothetical protein
LTEPWGVPDQLLRELVSLRAATKTVHAKGVVSEGRNGQMVHPAFKAQLQASAELRRWAIEYALTPASE